MLAGWLLVLAAVAQETPLRVVVAEVALAQAERVDPAWHPDQRDCAGLIRFAYRSAYRRLRPERLDAPLFEDAQGKPVDFADAKTLTGGSFVRLGRNEEARSELRSGDVLAFRQERGEGREPVFHLMLVVHTRGDAGGERLVVYHPGSPGAEVRVGPLQALDEEAPLEWKPVPENSSFLGFYRFKEWM